MHQSTTYILVTDYLSNIGIKTVPQPPYSLHLAPCDFWLFPKLRECRYERIEEMKEAVTNVIYTLTQKEFHEAFQKLLERYSKCIAAGGNYFEADLSFMCVLSIKFPRRKMPGNLFNDPRIYLFIYLSLPLSISLYSLHCFRFYFFILVSVSLFLSQSVCFCLLVWKSVRMYV